jgi:CHAT domain-containing protein
MLSDGDFTARDMFGWRLNPELVVLSACESGVSKVQAGDELIGLVRALLFAGTPTIVVSLWNAYDGSAAEIMNEFYRGHIEEKKSMALALADAQRTQIRKGAGAAQWAPFVVVGDWR